MTKATPFHELARLQKSDNNNYQWEVPDAWQQGRGAFGGLVLSATVQALEQAQAAHDPEGAKTLRTLSSMLCGPVFPDRAHFQTKLVREGNNTATWHVRQHQGGEDQTDEEEVKSETIALFASDRAEDATWDELQAPRLTDWQDLPALPIGPPLGPAFSQHMEYRTDDAIPMMMQKQTHDTHGWVRYKNPPEVADRAYIAMLMDAWWPCALLTRPKPRPLATISFTMQFLLDPSRIDTSRPLCYRASMPVCSRGYGVEFRELWTPEGELVALNQQTITIIK